MGFFEQIRQLNVEGYAKGGKAEKDTSKDQRDFGSSKGGKTAGPSAGKSDPVSGPSVGSKGQTSRSLGDFFGGLFGGGGDDGGTPVAGSRTSSPTPTPRPDRVNIPTAGGPRDVSFREYATISSDPTGLNARSLGYIPAGDLPSVSPEVESAINMYQLRDEAFDTGQPSYSYIDPATGELVTQELDFVTRGLNNMGILGAISGFTRNTILDQLTTPLSQYQGTGGAIGRFLTRPGENVNRYVPVTNERGMLIGSMSVDAEGNPIGYTGTQTTNAIFNDPNINQAAAAAMINPFGPDNDDSPAAAPQGPAFDPCPEGYTYDLETQSCKPDAVAAEGDDPFDQPFVTAPAAPMVTPAPNYTAVPPLQMPSLTPGAAPGLNFQTTPVQPIGFGPQMGIGSFAPRSI